MKNKEATKEKRKRKYNPEKYRKEERMECEYWKQENKYISE
jgi:hypothetical protein